MSNFKHFRSASYWFIRVSFRDWTIVTLLVSAEFHADSELFCDADSGVVLRNVQSFVPHQLDMEILL